MIKKDEFKLLLLVIVLFIISFAYAIIFGRTYTLNTNIKVNDINEVTIGIDEEDKLEITDKKIIDGNLVLELKPLKKGKVFIDVLTPKEKIFKLIYVHNFGIITCDRFLGDSNGDLLFRISSIIITISIIIYLIRKYKQSRKINFYNYKNIVYIGTIIFFIFSLIDQLLRIINCRDVYSIITGIISSASLMSFILLPLVIVVGSLVVISNIVLMKKEGFTWRNMLGVILGLTVIILTVLPDLLYSFISQRNIIDIHNEQGIYTYIEQFIESFISIINSYLECILIATIALSVKAAKYIPKFNKDYIIVLGCMIKKDGTLTPLLKSRVDRAIEFSKMQMDNSNKPITFVVSGGKGSDEPISEAEAMKNYLIEQGINPKKILVEDKSKSTYENIKYSYEIISKKNKDAQIAISTTNYHVFRAGVIANDQNIHVAGIGAKTKAYFWINAFIREFIATLYNERKSHLKMILLILAFTALLIISLYISNTL